jgi:PhnB protein
MNNHDTSGAPPEGYQTVSPYLLYEDADRAVGWLTQGFGFVERRVTTGAAGRNHHELILGDDGLVMLGQMGPAFRSMKTLGVDSPAMVHVYVEDVDALHQRAKAAGADVTGLEISPAGDKRFMATDPEGITWVFAQRISGQAR